MAVTKNDIAGKISVETGYPRRVVLEVVNSFTREVSASVSGGERVELRNFGVFYAGELGERLINNPKLGRKVRAPGKKVLRFRPGKRLKSI